MKFIPPCKSAARVQVGERTRYSVTAKLGDVCANLIDEWMGGVVPLQNKV